MKYFNAILKTTIIVAYFVLAAIPVCAQDLLARQAPVDRKMRALDTLALKSVTEREQMESPAAQLYEDWNNQYAHKATSNFGARWGRTHKGLDIKVYIGDTIRAAFSGKVRIVRYEGRGYGKYIVIRHNNGLETIYGHLSKQIVTENQIVRAGDPIGLGGNTGRSTGSHLHFETRLCGVALNPALFFDFRNQDVTGNFYTFKKETYDDDSRLATAERGKVGNGGYTRDLVQGGTPGHSKSANFNSSNEEILYHKVKKGETLYSIAEQRGVSVEMICRLNHITNRSKVRPGQILRYS